MAKILPFDPQAKGHIGVAIAVKSVAVVVMSPDRQVQCVTSKTTAPLLNGTTINGDSLTAAYKDIASQTSLPINKAAVIIPEKFAFSRTCTLPVLSTSEIDEAVAWQVEKLFPYDKKEIYIDWRLLKKSGKESQVVITAVPRDIIDTVKDSLLAAGLFPVSFEPSVTALARLVPTNINGPVVVVELDETGSSATIVINAVSQLTATAFYQNQNDASQIAAIVGKSVSDLILHWQEQNQSTIPFTIYLTGPLANSQNSDLLSKELRMPCSILPVDQVNATHHAAYSAALSVVLPPENDATINLLPQGLRRYYESAFVYQVTRQLSILAISISWIMVSLSLLGFIGLALITQQKVAFHAPQNAAMAGQVENLDIISRHAIRYNRLYDKKTTPEHIITGVYNAIPDNVIITSFSYDPAKGKLRVVGRGQDREAIITTWTAIADTSLFKVTDFPLTALSTAATGDFAFDLEVVK
jgi:hypothetical protein